MGTMPKFEIKTLTGKWILASENLFVLLTDAFFSSSFFWKKF